VDLKLLVGKSLCSIDQGQDPDQDDLKSQIWIRTKIKYCLSCYFRCLYLCKYYFLAVVANTPFCEKITCGWFTQVPVLVSNFNQAGFVTERVVIP
jgi:hypothetical protein